MYRLSSIVILLVGTVIGPIMAQSPHGDELELDCKVCHTPAGWEIDYSYIQFDHSSTAFSLEGTHTKTECISCHTSLVFDQAPNECIACHSDLHEMSVGNDCARCHSATTWIVDNIPELHEENGFPLVGAHSTLGCVDCHTGETNLVFQRIGNECINCHNDDYTTAQNPSHQNYSTNCIECHSPLVTDWGAYNTDHSFFPLTMGHEISNCTECHVGGNYDNISSDCVGCHQDDYNGTLNPNHSLAEFSTDCASCHTTSPGWTPATFEHEFFPLTLGHDTQDCAQCHTTGNYDNTSSECIECHQTDYNNTSNPDHTSVGYLTDCAQCHTTDPGWTPATIDHDFFPLTLGHDTQDCAQCHTTGSYDNTPSECIECHQTDYNNTSNPDHTSTGFLTDCAQCHTTEPGWTPATIDHDFFPLTLGHDTQDCAQCHTTNNYGDVSSECVECHQTNYTNTSSPNHNTVQFSTDCASCHTTDPGWTPTNWDHNSFYALNGAHATIADNCVECHINDNYTTTPNTCIGCHQTDYNNTNDPNHTAAQFPTDCIACHTETAWEPATFDHDGMYFPINSGPHREAWSSCLECHTNPASYADYTCLTCHTSTETNNNHSEVTDYQYLSSACLQCHPDGTN